MNVQRVSSPSITACVQVCRVLRPTLRISITAAAQAGRLKAIVQTHSFFFSSCTFPETGKHLDLQNAVLQFQLVHAKKTALALSALQTAHGASAARATGGEQRASPNGHRWVTKAMVGWEYWGLALPPRERHRCKEEERKAAWSTVGTIGETGTAGSSFL